MPPITITADNLNSMVEFDGPFRVREGGAVELHADGVYAPSVYHVEGAQAPHDVEIDGAGWEAWSASYTGQYGYRGAVLHSSEQLAGGIARDLLESPGVYAVCAVEVMPTEDDPEPEPAGWIVLRLEA